jgi:hypothetical protein
MVDQIIILTLYRNPFLFQIVRPHELDITVLFIVLQLVNIITVFFHSKSSPGNALSLFLLVLEVPRKGINPHFQKPENEG